ncbi:MAG: DUF1569 domain-containing protein [Crocinitomicaceae bacterium]|jgi:hypothetical protein|nr:DUF1569 domain-containing protein [Crocinitomicaceae bacterium]MCF8410246.1 DUF1569 domain-containing protein [Crocinitomicaceae bacterium]MCF8443935.1 DUF1569 domain-containing protein [Crocinitomicaceae bacterium]
MNFIEPTLETILVNLENLTPETEALWGSMSAQRMVEHLSDSLKMAVGQIVFPLEVPEDRIPRMKEFLLSDKVMAKNSEVPFAKKDQELRCADLELAIDELAENWVEFEEYFSEDEQRSTLHPYYGNLNFDEWNRLHAKHFTHHLQQFGLVGE